MLLLNSYENPELELLHLRKRVKELESKEQQLAGEQQKDNDTA